MSKCILITGGIRSGKSRFARELAEKAGRKILFVATAEARDEEMKERIGKHKRERPASWQTLETAACLAEKIGPELKHNQVVIIDCLNMLITNILNKYVPSNNSEDSNYRAVQEIVEKEITELEKCIHKSKATFIIVSNEVGMGLVSLNKMGRAYQDLLGTVNQGIASFSDEVYFMVSGIPLRIKPQ